MSSLVIEINDSFAIFLLKHQLFTQISGQQGGNVRNSCFSHQKRVYYFFLFIILFSTFFKLSILHLPAPALEIYSQNRARKSLTHPCDQNAYAQDGHAF
jgi:hypothetical protein